jgi:hypothetical protein
LRKYLLECLTIGYAEAPLEQEAIAIAQRIAEIPTSNVQHPENLQASISKSVAVHGS